MFKTAVLLAVLAVLTAGLPAHIVFNRPDFKPVAWPTVKLQLGPVGGVAVHPLRDLVYVVQRDTSLPPVYVFNGTTGDVVFTFGETHLQTPHGIRFAPAKDLAEPEVWVTDVDLHVARRFTSDGKLTATLGTPGINGSGLHPVQFSEPTDLAFFSDGRMAIADGDAGINNRVLIFDPELALVQAVGEKGSGPGQFFVPHSIQIDSLDRMWIADRNNARIQVLDKNGKYLGEKNCGWDVATPQEGQPFGLFIADDYMVITDGKANHTLIVPSPKPGAIESTCTVFETLRHENGVAHLPGGDKQRNIYIAEVGPAPLGAKCLKYSQ